MCLYKNKRAYQVLPYLNEQYFHLHSEIRLKSIMWMIWSEQYNKLITSYTSVFGDIFMS